MKAASRSLCGLAALLAAFAAAAADGIETIEMEGMSVIGNRESPNLLYIVPWKPAQLPQLDEPVLLTDPFGDALEPVERSEMVREIRYRNAWEQTRRQSGQPN